MIVRAKRAFGLWLEHAFPVYNKLSVVLTGITACVRVTVLLSKVLFVEVARLYCLPVRVLRDGILRLEGAVTVLAQR
jgi:hypothetical protein